MSDQRLSYEELAAENAQLRVMVDTLQAEVGELRRQLGLSSRNSSKPPSSDSPFTKPAPRSLRRTSGRKPGGQPGHPGSTLQLVADPDERLRHEPVACAGCGADLIGAPEAGVERRQVFDLPPMTVRVTEHQLVARRCVCETTTCGTAPEGVTAPVQYGPRITAIILYLYVGQFLSKKRLSYRRLSNGTVIRQRMDFLLLLPQRRRVVLEVDGRHHYASADGQADPATYASMVQEDRRLRLAGYELYRFGGYELMNEQQGGAMLDSFFNDLLESGS